MNWKAFLRQLMAEHLTPALHKHFDAILDNAVETSTPDKFTSSKVLVLAALAKTEGKVPDGYILRKRVARINETALEVAKLRGEDKPAFTLWSQKHAFELAISESALELVQTEHQQAVTGSALSVAADRESASEPENFQRPEFEPHPPDIESTPPTFNIFISHAHETSDIEAIVIEFYRKLKVKFKALAPEYQGRFKLDLWIDHRDMPGTNQFERNSDNACKNSHFAIYLLSDGWYASKPCQREHAHFVAMASDELDCRFIQAQLTGDFAYENADHGRNPCFPMMSDKLKDYSNLLELWEAGLAKRDALCIRIRDEICAYIANNLLKPSSPSGARTSKSNDFAPPPEKMMSAVTPDDISPPAQGIGDWLGGGSINIDEVELANVNDNLPPVIGTKEGGNEREDALKILFKWATSPDSKSRIFALLGSFGSGKTTTSQLFVRKLRDARKDNPDADYPMPIYLDLRRALQFYGPDREGKSAAELIRLSLHFHIRERVDSAALLEYMLENPCLVIFDGLDEIGTRIGPEALSALWREMLEIIPTEAWTSDRKAKAADWKKCATRILVTCRTHFFRDHLEQQSFIYERDRLRGLERSDGYEPVQTRYMAAFTPMEIRSLFRRQLGDDGGEAAYQAITGIPDLVGLASKPIMARYIAELSPDLIGDRYAGRIINAAAIYHHLFRRALERDGDKRPILKRLDRQKMLEALAEHLWQLRAPEIEVDALDEWFDEYAERTPGVRMSAQSGPQARGLLQTELRNASLLIRMGESKFRFVHTSFFEFFLARRILARLIDGSHAELTSLPDVSAETRRFIIDLVRYEEGEQEFKAGLERALASGQPHDLRALAAALHFEACGCGIAHALPVGADLSGLNLRDHEWRDETLRGVDFSGSNLLQARFTNVKFDSCCFEGTNVWSVVFDHCAFANCIGNAIGAEAARLRGGTSNATSDSSLISNIVHRVSKPHSKAALRKLPPAIRAAINWSPPSFASFSPDGSWIVTGSHDNAAQLWDARTGDELRSFEGHKGAVTSARFSPDGKWIVTSSTDSTARLWDAHTGTKLHSFEGHIFEVTCASFSHDSNWIVTGSYDKTARLWDARTGHELRRFNGHNGPVLSACFSPDGRWIVTGAHDEATLLWDANSGEALRHFKGHTGSVHSAVFSPDGRFIATGSTDKTMKLWDTQTGEQMCCFEGHGESVASVSFSPDGKLIATGSDDLTARLWDVQTGDPLRQFKTYRFKERRANSKSVSFSPDSKLILTGSYDQVARLWDARTGDELRRFNGVGDWVNSISFSNRGSLIVTGSTDMIARIWDAQTGFELRRFEGHVDAITSASFSPNDRWIVTGSRDRTARVWDIQTGNEVQRFSRHETPVSSASFSPDGNRIVTCSGDSVGRLWNAHTGEELRRFEGHHSRVTHASFSPNGDWIVTASNDQTARLWDAHTGDELRCFNNHERSVNSASFSPNGDRIVTASNDHTVRLWNAHNGDQLSRLKGHQDKITSASFSPDGGRLVTASYDKTARLWDALTGEELHRFKGHRGPLSSANFSPDGRRIVTGSNDRTARLWDARSGAMLRTIVPLPRGWVHLSTDGWVIDYAPEAWEYLYGIDLLPDGGRRIVNLWDHIAAA